MKASGCVPKSWEVGKRINKQGVNGVYVYTLKKNGERYKKPDFTRFHGDEKSGEQVLERLAKLNPNMKFELA